MKLEFKNVTKQYGEVNAVNKVNCVMEKGIYGLLGVNGAGKTTLMRMLCTIVQPSEGQILWNGKDIWKLGGEYREVLGYLPQDFGYYPDLTVYDYMMYISSIKGLKMPFARKKVKQLLNQVGMEKFSKRKMKNLSGGMVRRVGIAQAMLNDPKILVLDEPTAGLDPNERIRFRNLISELSEERLVLLSTHIVSDIEYIANNIMLMKDGELFYAGTAEDLVSSMKEKVWQCNVSRSMIDKYMNEYLGSLRVPSAALSTPTPASSTRAAHTRSSTSCPTRATRLTRAVHCASARIRATSCPARRWKPATARSTSPSATATGTSSTTTTVRLCRKRGSCSPACHRTATSWRPLRFPKTTFISAFSTTPSSRAARTRRTPCSRG